MILVSIIYCGYTVVFIVGFVMEKQESNKTVKLLQYKLLMFSITLYITNLEYIYISLNNEQKRATADYFRVYKVGFKHLAIHI